MKPKKLFSSHSLCLRAGTGAATLLLLVLSGCASPGNTVDQELQCSRKVSSAQEGLVATLPSAAKLSSLTFRDKKTAGGAQYVPAALVAGRNVRVLCEEEYPGPTGITNRVYAVQVDGVPLARYADPIYFSAVTWLEQDRKAYEKDLAAVLPFKGKSLWSKQVNSLFRSPAGDLLAGTRGLDNLEEVRVEEVSLGEDMRQATRLVLQLRLADGSVGYAHYEGPVAAADFYRAWYTTDPVKAHPNVTPEQWRQIRQRRYAVGMPEPVIRLMLGAPQAVNRTQLEGLSVEQHVYEDALGKRRYFYYRDGILRTIQD